MNKVTQTSIKQLEGAQDTPVLSMYMPTHRSPSPPHMQEDQIRFKNMIREGFEQWGSVVDPKLVEPMRRELLEKLDDTDFWKDAIESMAMFVSPKEVHIYHLPIECEERVFVGDTYDTIPLHLIAYMNQPAYVFALAQHTPKLFKADLYDIQAVEVDFPDSPEDALNIDEMFANSNTIRHGRSAGANSIASAPHGQGDSSEAGQEERLMYLRILDEKLHTHKGFDSTLPLIIAATDTEYGDFKALTRSKTVVDGYIAGNYTDVPLNELHNRVRTVLFETVLDQKQRQALEKLHESYSTNSSETIENTMKAAADEGRIDSLFLPLIDMTNDSVSDTNESHPLMRFGQELSKDSARLARSVALHGGTLVPLLRTAVLPKNAALAATYRY